MSLRAKQAAPQITDSALRLPVDFPELPADALERFPSLGTWMNDVSRFWKQNVNAVDDFARAVLDVTEIGGLFIVDGANQSVYVKGTRDRGGYSDPDTPVYFDKRGYFSLKNKLTWNADTNILTVDGTIIATAGEIGGFEIGPDYIRDEGDTFGLSSDSTGPAPYVRFWAGSTFAARATAPFRVYSDGAVVATNATISGSITATSGSIGGWAIGATTLSGGNAVLSSAGTLLLGTANDVVIVDANDATYRLWVGNATAGSANFRVTKAGVMTATEAVIGGTGVDGNFVSITGNGLQVGDDPTSGTIHIDDNSGIPYINLRYNSNVYGTWSVSSTKSVMQLSDNAANSVTIDGVGQIVVFGGVGTFGFTSTNNVLILGELHTGTFAALGAEVLTGYLTGFDVAGTPRKIAVIA